MLVGLAFGAGSADREPTEGTVDGRVADETT
jgi:hypothetical protein